MKKQDSVHNQGIRQCTGAFKSSPVISLYTESGEQSLELRREQLGLQHIIRMARMPQLPIFAAVLNHNDNLFRNCLSKSPLSVRINKLITELQINEFNILPYQVPVEPPWKLAENLVCSDLINKNKRI